MFEFALYNYSRVRSGSFMFVYNTFIIYKSIVKWEYLIS